MAKTYDYLPYDPADLFRPIVAIVNDNLTTDADLNISRVKYRAETILELVKQLQIDGEAEPYKGQRYPLIALVRRYEQGIRKDTPYIDAEFDFVIATLSEKNWDSARRKTETYDPIIWPIYTEFLEQIAFSAYFQGPYNPYPEHKVYESFNFGQRTPDGNKGYSFPDNVDALVITGMKLRINRPRVAGFNYGNGKQISYLNNVSQLSCALDSNILTVRLVDAAYSSTVPGSPTYTVYTSHDNASKSLAGIGSSRTYNFEAESGQFYGYIQSDDSNTRSKLYFFYSVTQGQVSRFMTSNKFKMSNFQLLGLDYPDYPFDVAMDCICNKAIILSRQLLADGGNLENDEQFTPAVADTDDVTVVLYGEAPTTYRDIVCAITIDGPGNTSTLLESISYYKLL